MVLLALTQPIWFARGCQPHLFQFCIQFYTFELRYLSGWSYWLRGSGRGTYCSVRLIKTDTDLFCICTRAFWPSNSPAVFVW